MERGAKPVEVEGLAKSTAARLMSLAVGAQTLLTRAAYDVARRSAASEGDWDLRPLGGIEGGLQHYESQTEEEAMAEDEAAFEHTETIMQVPIDLVPVVHELIAKHRAA